MATVQGVAVVVGDWLRCNDDEWEGRVTAVDSSAVTLLMGSGDVRVVAAGDVHWDWWDPRATP